MKGRDLNQVLLFLSFVALTVQLIIIVLFGYQLYQFKKKLDQQSTFFTDHFLERSFEINKASNDLRLIISLQFRDEDWRSTKEQLLNHGSVFLAHSWTVELPIQASPFILLENNDPLFLEVQYKEIIAEYKTLVGILENQITTIRKTESPKEINSQIDEIKLTANDIQGLINQLNNIFSNLTSYYLSHAKQISDLNSKNIRLFLGLLVFSAFFSISLIAFFVISKQKSEKLIKSQERMLRMISSNYPSILSIVEKDYTLSFNTGREFQRIGKDPENLDGKPVKALFEKQSDVVTSYCQKTFEGSEQCFELVIEDDFYHLHSIPLSGQKGQIERVLLVVDNITERIIAEKKIKSALKEKETLFGEVHHRVKNNMQVISSLLQMQASKTDNEQIKEALNVSRNRIFTMSQIHRDLYESSSLSEIDLSSYLTKLTSNLKQAYQINKNQIRLQLKADSIIASIEIANPFGLIINELVTNSLKHAFPGGRSGTIQINLSENDGTNVLVVSDNGVGANEGNCAGKHGKMGLELVQTLVEDQLDGTFEINFNLGTLVTITFPSQ